MPAWFVHRSKIHTQICDVRQMSNHISLAAIRWKNTRKDKLARTHDYKQIALLNNLICNLAKKESRQLWGPCMPAWFVHRSKIHNQICDVRQMSNHTSLAAIRWKNTRKDKLARTHDDELQWNCSSILYPPPTFAEIKRSRSSKRNDMHACLACHVAKSHLALTGYRSHLTLTRWWVVSELWAWTANDWIVSAKASKQAKHPPCALSWGLSWPPRAGLLDLLSLGCVLLRTCT